MIDLRGGCAIVLLVLSSWGMPAIAQTSSPADTVPPSTDQAPPVPELKPADPNPPKPKEGAAPVNPLELNTADPLLPSAAINRPLNPQEQTVLSTALDEVQKQAAARLQAGDVPGAFDLWNRELRLRRFLGPRQEVASLTRVGQVSWQQSQTTELRLITQRLQVIEQEAEAKPNPDYDLLLAIAQGYEAVHAHTPTVALYQKLADRAKQQQDTEREQQYLTALATTHLAWFDYPNAATTYDQLLTLAKAKGDSDTEVEALKKLSYIYQENNQPEQAIAAQQQLIEVYQQQKNLTDIPALKLGIGDSYVALKRPDLAATSYQEAFAVARAGQQLAYASDALQRLATLYQSLQRSNDALVVYQLLLDVEQQSYNTYGMMNTYDQIGQLHKAQGEKTQAMAAFRQGLQIAQQLNYKVDYFNTQIQQVSQ
jgi:tetratricopeptide (TPR) repeat protein